MVGFRTDRQTIQATIEVKVVSIRVWSFTRSSHRACTRWECPATSNASMASVLSWREIVDFVVGQVVQKVIPWDISAATNCCFGKT